MPELPEVEVARKLVERECVGKRITSVIALESGGGPRDGLFDEIIFDAAAAGFSSADDVRSRLEGRILTASCRKGKQMWWQLDGKGDLPTWHFGMTGSFSICKPSGDAASGSKYVRVQVDTSSWPPRFTKCEVVFADGTRLAFTDPRRLGRVKFVSDVHAQPPVSELGPDPLLDMMPLPAFRTALASRSLPIKALLLDQSFLAGIGNWIADEVLYQACIHPETAASALDEGEVAALHERIVGVIAAACAVDADNARFPPKWLFHVRWNKRSKDAVHTVAGQKITYVTVGGRTSAVVTAVQGAPRKTPALDSAPARAARRGEHLAWLQEGVASAGAAAAGGAASVPEELVTAGHKVVRKRARTAGDAAHPASDKPGVEVAASPAPAVPEVAPAPSAPRRGRKAAGKVATTAAAASAAVAVKAAVEAVVKSATAGKRRRGAA